MALSEKLWDTLTTVIKMNDKVERLAGTVKDQQARIEDLTVKVIRLETMVELLLASGGRAIPPTAAGSRRLPDKR